MKETGLMFKAPLVRAILSGQKTQTRRIAKDVRHPDLGNWYAPGALVLEGEPQHVIDRACPWGQPGDRIYVRETVRSCRAYEVQGYPPSEWGNKPIWFDAEGTPPGAATAWATKATPAIHMPKWVARIWLEITGVRVERLQEISDTDALAEGVDRTNTSIPGYARERFKALWDSTTGRPELPRNENSKRYARVKHWLDTHPDTTGWDANPWVWVIDFKRIEKP